MDKNHIYFNHNYGMQITLHLYLMKALIDNNNQTRVLTPNLPCFFRSELTLNLNKFDNMAHIIRFDIARCKFLSLTRGIIFYSAAKSKRNANEQLLHVIKKSAAQEDNKQDLVSNLRRRRYVHTYLP